jgi:hypothetical protein
MLPPAESPPKPMRWDGTALFNGHNPNTGSLRLLHHIRRVATAGKSNHDIRPAFRQYARIAKRTRSSCAAKRSPFRSERLRSDAACLRPFKGERIAATSAAGNDRREGILSVKAIELCIKLGAIGVGTAAADQNPNGVIDAALRSNSARA